MFARVTLVAIRNFSGITKSCISTKTCFPIRASRRKFLDFNSSTICRSFCLSSQLQEKVEMVTITFVKSDGSHLKKTAPVGKFVQDIFENDPDFDGYGACGGTLSCSTCHVILSPEDNAKASPMSDEEKDLIVYAPGNCPTSRLGCNVELTKELDGAIMQLPEKTADRREEEDK